MSATQPSPRWAAMTRGHAVAIAVRSLTLRGRWEYGGLEVIGISIPANPQRIGGSGTKGEATDVAVAGPYVCVGGRWGMAAGD